MTASGWTWVAAAVLATVLLVSTACARVVNQLVDDPDAAGEAAQAQQRPCAALAVGSCALPYPSDEFTVADRTTATGIRVEMPPELIPAGLREALGPGAHVEDAFGGRDGFSALSPVIFELNAPIRAESLPPGGGDRFVVLDATTGERAEIRAEVWDEALLRGSPGTIVMAWPVTTWEYGHTYVAGVSDLEGLLTDPVAPTALTDPGPRVGGIVDTLRSAGVDPDGAFLGVTGFTIGSRASATSAIETMAARARSEDHPVRRLEVLPPAWFRPGSAIIIGEIRTSDFRDDEGVVHPDAAGGHEWVPFVLAVPERIDGASAPVAVYGHGLLASKETMVAVASHNAARGVATIGIDVPNHGARQAGQGGYLLELTNPRDLGRLAGVPLQGMIDQISLVRAIVEHMGGIDLAPWSPDGSHGDGVSDIDTTLLLYEGTSMGGVLGVGEYALIPELDAAFLQVPGAGILDILAHSQLWVLFRSVIPEAADAGDAAALLGMASMLLDRADPTHLVEGLAASGRPVVVQVGVGDLVLPEFASDRLVRMLELPRIGPERTGISATGHVDELPPDGRVFQELWPYHSSPASRGLMAHLVFTEPAAAQLLDSWLLQRLTLAGKASGSATHG